jgi:hypothetical protein
MLFTFISYFTLYINFSTMIATTAFDRSALCAEIRSRIEYGSGHHWCIDIDNRVYMQSVSCAKCGNYQQVSSYPLYALIQSAKSVVCEDPEHIRITNETIFMERGGRSPAMDSDLRDRTLEEEDLEEDLEEDYDHEEPPIMRYSEEFEVRNERLDDWSQEEENYDWASDNYFPGN